MALESEERPNQSITKFESMLKTDDVYFFDAEDFEEIIHHYLNHGKIALAKKAIKIGLQQHPDSTALKLLHIEVLVFENNLEVAEHMLDELQLLETSNEEIYIQRANIYSKKDNHEAAVSLLQEALMISDECFDIYSLLGMEYLFMDDFKMAKESFMKCVSFDEQDYSSLYNVIYCFEFLEDYDGAINYLNEYLERNPYCEVAWHQLGKQYYVKRMYEEALTAFDFAIISDNNFMGAYYEKGKVLEKMGKFEEAIENYETTLALEDPTSHTYLRIGRCYEKLGSDDMAKHHYYKTVHEDPLLDKGWLVITEFYYRKEEYAKALHYINKALNIDGDNPDYWKKCGKIHVAMCNFDEADLAYKQAVDMGSYDLETWLSWASVSQRAENYNAAIEILSQAQKLFSDSSEIAYKKAGLYLMMGDKINGRIGMMKALKQNFTQLHLFQEEFPQYVGIGWIQELINASKKASQ